MSSVDDLVAWLRAQLDEDERVALACRYQTWTRDGASIYSGHPTDEVVDWVYDEGGWEHIALHDPARVLREVEAKRRILARHHRWSDDNPGVWAPSYQANACVGCRTYGDCDDPYIEDINECPELLDMAFGYGREEPPRPAV